MFSGELATDGSTKAKAPTQTRHRRVRAIPGGIAAVAVTVVLWTAAGTSGLIGGCTLLLAWALLPASYAFAVGQIAVVAVMRPDSLVDGTLFLLGGLELGLAGVLLGPSLRSAIGRRIAAWTLLGGAALGGVALVSYFYWGQVWIAASVLIGSSVFSAYMIHRYELVVLENVPEFDDG